MRHPTGISPAQKVHVYDFVCASSRVCPASNYWVEINSRGLVRRRISSLPIDEASLELRIVPDNLSQAVTMAHPAPIPTSLALDEETIDDLLYETRAGDLSSLTTLLTTLSTTNSQPQSHILLAAVDFISRNTPLHYAAANNHLPITTYLLSLLPASPSRPDATSKAILDAQNDAGNTSLHWAALNGHLEIVKALVNAGADPGVRNKAGRDAIVEAEIAGESSETEKGKNALECAVWMLEVWAGAEEGLGGHAEAGDNEDEDSKVNGEHSAEDTNGASEQKP